MASEAITQNDLKAVLDEVLPVEPSEYRKLLWTNPSPTSAFSAQTVLLDLSEYDAVEIEAYLTAGGMTSTRLTEVGKQGETGGLGSIGTPYCRNANVTTTGITFTEGKSGSTTNNTYAIPINIYGIKYEGVAPPQTDAFIFENYTDGLGYTVGAGATRDVTFTAPTKAGYTLKQVSCILNQNYASVGVALINGVIHISLHNYLSASNDIGITLQYIWEHN